MDKKTKVVFILGPTGVGKTKLSVKLAKKFDGQIISADSVQVFKHFDIGSAKVTKEEMQGVVHYGIDVVSPEDEFSVFDYLNYTKQKIEEIKVNQKLPFIVGGTGLYVKALVNGYNLGGTGRNEEFRKNVLKEIEINGLESVYNQLKTKSPLLAKNIDCHNKVRVIRALEIATFGEDKKQELTSEYDFLIFALNLNREKLYQRINLRVDEMVKNGVVEEVKALYNKYGMCQAMSAIGYKEFIPYFEGKQALEECKELVKQHSRNYAKRQLTFLRGMTDVNFIDVEDVNNAFEIMSEKIENWLN